MILFFFFSLQTKKSAPVEHYKEEEYFSSSESEVDSGDDSDWRLTPLLKRKRSPRRRTFVVIVICLPSLFKLRSLKMFRDSNVTFFAKIRKQIRVRFWVINLIMLPNRGYRPVSHRIIHKICIFKKKLKIKMHS